MARHRRKKHDTTGLLPYNTTLGNDISLPDNLDQQFTGVVSQVYPLKASLTRLTEFCNNYLNFADDVGKFPLSVRPSLPLVFMQVVYYGKMAIDPGDIGWFSQREVAFGIPLEWQHDEANGKVLEPALVYPFIYVDNALSVASGREVYGWAKKSMHLTNKPGDLRPTTPNRLLSLHLENPCATTTKRERPQSRPRVYRGLSVPAIPLRPSGTSRVHKKPAARAQRFGNRCLQPARTRGRASFRI